MAKFLGGSTLYNPDSIVCVFPRQVGAQEWAFAQLKSGGEVALKELWETVVHHNETAGLAVFPNADPSLSAVIYFPPNDRSDKPEILRLPIVGWRLPIEWSDSGCLVPLTLYGDYDPGRDDCEIAVKSPLGFISLGHGEVYASEMEFVVKANERRARRKTT